VIDKNVKVFSFDGSSYLTAMNHAIVEEIFPTTMPEYNERRQMWTYSNFAVSDHVGTARFTKQSKDKNAGFEGGGIRPSAPVDETEEVPMTALDTFVTQHAIEHVDLLKIDTEGNDNKVLLGAATIIKDQVGMFTFEGGKGITFSKEMIDLYDSWGFSCYSTSRAGLFKWNGGCMKEKYMGGFRAKDKGNIFCVHRSRAALTALSFDILTFPVMAEFLLKEMPRRKEGFVLSKEDSLLADHFFGNQSLPKGMNADVQLSGIDPALLTSLYVNIRGFCKPWPLCAKL
jgi:FkbM family methyltransferase